MTFSVVLICRNESRTIPRLMASLREFQARGGEVVLLDTGSTDGSAELAQQLGAQVEKVGERFLYTLTKQQAQLINESCDPAEPPAVKAGDRVFDYAAARNFAASLARNDMVAMPDCDEEYTRLDLDAIERAIANGGEQLEYDFVYAHDEHGNEVVKFRHCKFYDRRKLRWVGIVHEVLQGAANRVYLPPEVIKLEHWQIPSENRSRYLAGLALDVTLNPLNDRNAHYYARELMYSGRPRSAIAEFRRHLKLKGWPAEAAQSVVFIGDCFSAINQPEAAVSHWLEAYQRDPSRREAPMRLAWHYYRLQDAHRAAFFASGAETIPWSDFYANNVAHYRHEPHEILYWAHWQLGDRERSYYHWRKARELAPEVRKYQRDAEHYIEFLNPKVSIVIPTLGREQQLKALVESLTPEMTGWANFEVVVSHDSFDNRQGAPKTLNRGVADSSGNFVCFLGNDCRPTPGFLRHALAAMFREFPNADGLVGLNDGIWQKGEIATHWLASKALLPLLGGVFFHEGYKHAACDNELTGRCQLLGKYFWCAEARIEHDHPARLGWDKSDEVHTLAYANVEHDRALLRQRAAEFGFTHLLV